MKEKLEQLISDLQDEIKQYFDYDVPSEHHPMDIHRKLELFKVKVAQELNLR